MVSGRLSLPQSVSLQPFQAPARPAPKRAASTDTAPETRDFKSSFAPERQDLRSSRTDRPRSAETEPGSSRLSDRESTGSKQPAHNTDRAQASREDTKPTESVDSEPTADTYEGAETDEAQGTIQDQTSDSSPSDSESADHTDESDSDQSAETDAAVQPQAESAHTDQSVLAPEQGSAKQPRQQANTKSDQESVPRRVNGTQADKRDGAIRQHAQTTTQDQATSQQKSGASDAESAEAESTVLTNGRAKTAEAEAEHSRSNSRSSTEQSQSEASHAQGETGSEQSDSEDQPRGDRQHTHADHSNKRRSGDQAAKSEESVTQASKQETLSSSATSNADASTDNIKAEARPEPQRAAQKPAPLRQDAPVQEAAQPAKLAGPSVSERLAQSGLNTSERAVLQARADGDSVTNQAVARGMNAVFRQGGGALTMKLSPASLGEVRIEMSMQGGKVSLQFDVGNVAAYEAIKGQLGELKQSLEQRGMTVERVETHVSPALARSNQTENQSNQRGNDQAGQNAQDRQDAADGQSRGRADGGDRESHGSSWDTPDGDAQEFDFEQSLRLGLDAVA